MCSGVEVWGMILNQTVDNDGEEVWGEVGVFAIGLRYDVDERRKVCRENSVSCKVILVYAFRRGCLLSRSRQKVKRPRKPRQPDRHERTFCLKVRTRAQLESQSQNGFLQRIQPEVFHEC